MRRVLAIVLVLFLFIGVVGITPVYAQAKKGASARAYERASDEAVFHRIGDWFATRGKSEEEKEKIVAERKAKRAAARAQKEAEKRKRKLEKDAKEAQKKLQERVKKKK
jgi:hypothetical protein